MFSERLRNGRAPPDRREGLRGCAASRWSLRSEGRAKRAPRRPPHGGSAMKSDLRGRQPALANEIWVLAGTRLHPTGAGQKCGERANPGSVARGGGGGEEVVLCEHVRGGGDGDELPEDVLGHLHIVLCNHQCFLDVLVGVALTHQVLDL